MSFHTKRTNHFDRFGLPPSHEIDLEALEALYLRESRKVHPDSNPDLGEGGPISASADLNEAFEVLSDPWKRFPYLLELLRPGLLEATKEMGRGFLLEAMETGERVEEARGDPGLRKAMREELEGRLTALQARVHEELSGKDLARAARTIHEARYLQRALENLDRKSDF